MNAVNWRRAGACLLGLALIGVGWGAPSAARAQGDGASEPAEAAAAAELPNETYYALRPDLRRCAFPLCGGFFVQRVNREQTRCADGSWRDECYVAELALGALGLSPEEESGLRARAREFLLRGSLSRTRIGGQRVGSFSAQEAWHGHEGAAPRGIFYRTRDRGIVCITFPCPSVGARRLNTDRREVDIAGVDLSGVSADPSDGAAQLAQPEGLLVAARARRVSGPGGSASELVASEYYLPFPGGAPQSCGGLRPGGPAECASGEFCVFPPDAICGRADATGICAAIPQSCEPGAGAPVCGCDGRSYASECEAARAGVSVDADVQPPTCGLQACDLAGHGCAADEVCDFGAPGQCNVSGASGVCRPAPDPSGGICPTIFDPVCGCDGHTYSNACVAAARGASIAHDGECP